MAPYHVHMRTTSLAFANIAVTHMEHLGLLSSFVYSGHVSSLPLKRKDQDFLSREVFVSQAQGPRPFAPQSCNCLFLILYFTAQSLQSLSVRTGLQAWPRNV
jgi:hypothetical protein